MRIQNIEEFLKSPDGANAQKELKRIVASSSYNTSGSYNPGSGGGSVFIRRHLDYLLKHPQVSPDAYMSNLRIMTKINR